MNDAAAALTPIDKVIRLQTVDVFKYATTEMLSRIGSIAEEVRAAKGDVVFREDDVSDAMYVVVQGQVRLDRGEEHVMMVGGGKSFGTWALFDNKPRMMKATAVESVHLLKIRSDAFYELLSDYDEITPAIFKAVIERVNSLITE